MENEMFEQLSNYLKTFMIQNNWNDEYTPKQARAIFTTICLYYGLCPDTCLVDNLLIELYNSCDLESCDVSYDEFDLFMCELLV
jgi:hypothetical protein